MSIPSHLVDVHIAVYNHAHYLQQTIDSVLNQQTDFSFRLLIGDDCSTDGSIDILKKYEKSYPEKINVVYQPRNLGLQSPDRNGIVLLRQSTAKYVAWLDGDDYWIDPQKLQKQVDFLRDNPQFVICFTRGLVANTFSGSTNPNSDNLGGLEFGIADLIKANNQLTATALFVNNPDFILPDWYASLAFGDWALYLYLMYKNKKKAFCLPDITAVYRIHGAGSHGNLHSSNNKLITAYKMHIHFYNMIGHKLFRDSYKKEIRNAISDKSRIIIQLYCDEAQYMKGLKVNISFLFNNLSTGVFFQNILVIAKSAVKGISRYKTVPF